MEPRISKKTTFGPFNETFGSGSNDCSQKAEIENLQIGRSESFDTCRDNSFPDNMSVPKKKELPYYDYDQ